MTRVHTVVTDNTAGFYSGEDDPSLTPLRELGDVTVYSTPSGSPAEVFRRVADANYLLYLRRPAPINDAFLAAAPALRAVAFPGVGTDHIDLAAAKRRGVAVTNAPGANASAVAELAIGLMFAVARRIPRADSLMRSGLWKKHEGIELYGKRLGVIGLGAIGSRVAMLGAGLGITRRARPAA